MNPFIIEQSPDDLLLTAQFQNRAVLAGIRLRSFSAQGASKEPEIAEGLQLELKHEARRGEIDAGRACFDLAMTIEALGDGLREKLLFHVDCVFELLFDLDPEFSPSKEQLAAFQRGNAVFLCWPYMREFVQNSTGRLGLVVPPVPLLRIAPISTPKTELPERRRKSRAKQVPKHPA